MAENTNELNGAVSRLKQDLASGKVKADELLNMLDMTNLLPSAKDAVRQQIVSANTLNQDTLGQLAQPESAVTLDDLVSVEEEAPVANKASNVNTAAYIAAVDDSQSSIDTYRMVQSDLDSTGQSVLGEEILRKAKEATAGEARSALAEFIMNPDIDEQTKLRVAQEFLDTTNERFNIRNIYSERALVEDSEGENLEQETVRLSLGEAINEVNRAKRLDQALLNSEVAKTDFDTLTAFFDIAQYLTPFQETTMGAKLLKDFRKYQETGDGDATGIALDAMFLAGSAKEEIVEGLKKLPPMERTQLKAALASLINQSSSIVLADENDFARVQMLNTFINEDYSSGDKWVDNVIALLDMTIIGGPLARLAKKFKKAPPLEGEYIPRDVPTTPTGGTPLEGRVFEHEATAIDTQRFVKSHVQPTSIASNVKDVNPAKAAGIHDAVAKEVTGEAASGLYGTDRVSAVANDLTMEIKRTDGIVDNKVGNIGRQLDAEITPSPELLEFVKRDGAIYYVESEKRRARAAVYEDFNNALGLTLRHEMSTFKDTPRGVSIGAVYGPSESGFANARQAVDQTLYALRDYGVTAKDVTVLQRTPSGYKPVPKTHNMDKEGDYLVSIDYDHSFSPKDIEEFEGFTIKNNFLDRFAGTLRAPRFGSATRMVLDPASVQDPRTLLSANVAVDRTAGLEKLLLEQGDKFAQQFNKLPKEKQAAVDYYIKEANHRGIPFDPNKMLADGFSRAEVDAVVEWRKAWDNIYWLENRDVVRNLKTNGYMLLQDTKNRTRLIARPVSQGQVGAGVTVYDPVMDTVRNLDARQVSELYQNNGTVAKLRTPESIDGDVVEFVLSPNKPDTAYFRAISESDQILNYRHGYYQVNYKAPQFVVERVKDKNGRVLHEKAVAVAGNFKDASHEATRLATTTGKRFDNSDVTADFYVRGDIKKEFRGDDFFDLQHAAGRSAQRVRGQRLRDASAPNNVGSDHSFVLDPVQSLIASARSVSRRVFMKDWLEASKSRYMSQYGHFLKKDQFGKPMFPNKVDDISKLGRSTDKDVADARTAWEYIRYMEDGYINAIDDAYKASLNGVADILGKVTSKGERAVRTLADSRGPLEFSRNMAFNLYLVGHPLRQAVIQSHQAIMLIPNHFEYVTSGKLTRELYSVIAGGSLGLDPKVAAKIAGMTDADYAQLLKDVTRSGLIAAVDKQNLVRGSLSSLADTVSALPVIKQAKAVKDFSRKIGFDLGETFNILSAFLAERNAMLQAGKKLDDANLDIAAGRARNYTFNMNAAGDMPYNQNMLSMLFQFVQVPHKAITSMTTNRVLTGAEKARLAGFSAVMFSLPAGSMYALFGDHLPEDPEMRDLVVQGLEGYMLNSALNYITGENERIDFSSLGPLDAYGLYEFAVTLFTEDLGKIVSNSPSGQLFFGNNPRITNSLKSLARYFNWIDDTKEPTEFMDVVKTSASMFSGMSSAFKAAYIMEAGKKMSTSGALIGEAGDVAAIAALFGFPTMKEVEQAYVKSKMYKDKDTLRGDVEEYYRALKQQLAMKGISIQDPEFLKRSLSSAWMVFGQNDREARNMVLQLIERDVKAGDLSLIQQTLRQSGFKTNEEIRRELQVIEGWSEQNKKLIQDNFDSLDEIRKEK